MAADSDPVEKPRSSSASEIPEDLKSELSLQFAEATNRSERRGELEIQRLKLYADVADLDERLAKLQQDSALTAGQRTIHRAYLQHFREKTLISIRLMQLEQEVAGARLEHTVSKTPGAHKNWGNRQQMRRMGEALGGGHPTRRQVPLPVTKGPEEEALGKLLQAETEYRGAKAQLGELCKKDSYFESLIGAEVEERKHASRASGQVLPSPEVNPRGGPPSTPEETAEPGKGCTPQASDLAAKLKAGATSAVDIRLAAPGVGLPLVDMRKPARTIAKETKRAALAKGSPYRDVPDLDRILNAVEYKKANGCTYPEASLKEFGNRDWADKIRYWHNKRSHGEL